MGFRSGWSSLGFGSDPRKKVDAVNSPLPFFFRYKNQNTDPTVKKPPVPDPTFKRHPDPNGSGSVTQHTIKEHIICQYQIIFFIMNVMVFFLKINKDKLSIEAKQRTNKESERETNR